VRLLVPRTDPQVPVNPARGLISILTARSLPPFPRTLASRRSMSSSTAATRRTGGPTDAGSRRRFRKHHGARPAWPPYPAPRPGGQVP
jgi:hypothetical protein